MTGSHTPGTEAGLGTGPALWASTTFSYLLTLATTPPTPAVLLGGPIQKLSLPSTPLLVFLNCRVFYKSVEAAEETLLWRCQSFSYHG